MTKVTGIGKNIEKAIEDALLQLKTSRDNVDIKIIETGGLFKKAKVEVEISKDYLEEYNKAKKIKEKILKQEVKVDSLKNKANSAEEKPKPENKKQQKSEKSEQEKSKQPVVKPAKNEKPKAKALGVERVEKKVENQEKKGKVAQPKQAKQGNSEKSEAQTGKEFLEGFISLAGLSAVVDVFEDEDEIFYTILGEDAASLIGYRGECLNSLQFLVSTLNSKENRRRKRVRLDIDGYREKRKGTLEMLARRVAKKVQKTGRQTRLEPMTAYERRIIHTAIQEFEGVTSLSRGQEPHRYLIIRANKPKEETTKEEIKEEIKTTEKSQTTEETQTKNDDE